MNRRKGKTRSFEQELGWVYQKDKTNLEGNQGRLQERDSGEYTLERIKGPHWVKYKNNDFTEHNSYDYPDELIQEEDGVSYIFRIKNKGRRSHQGYKVDKASQGSNMY